MRILLDSNVCIEVLRSRSTALTWKLREQHVADLAVSAVTVAELQYGARRSREPAKSLRSLDAFLAPLTVIAFDDHAAPHAGRIRAELAAQGTPIGPNDLLIAATAVAHDITLVTHNVREFGRVVGLRLEDWQGDD